MIPPVKRDLGRVRMVAGLLERDLRLDSGSWTVLVDDNYAVTVSKGDHRGVVRLDDDVLEDNWLEEAWRNYPEETLEDEISEVLIERIALLVQTWS
jgi:hypothetical protein